MPAVTYDLTVEAGALLTTVFEWREDDGSDPPTGALIDTTGYQARMQIRTKAGGELLASLDAAHGLTVTGGVVTLRLGADVSETLPPVTKAVYDVKLYSITDPSDVIRLVQGKVTISPDVTRDAP